MYLEEIHSAIAKQDDATLNKIVYDIYGLEKGEQKQIESI